MRTRPLGRTGIQLSPYRLGTTMFGAGNPDRSECHRIVHRALGEPVRDLRRMRWVPGHTTDERKLDAVEALIPSAAAARLSPTHLAMAFAITHPGITSTAIGPRTPAQLDDLPAGAVVALDDEVPDRIDRIVAPGTDIGPLDVAYVPPAAEFAGPAADRAAAR